MSKPGGKPIVKKRPFFEDDNIVIFSFAEGGKFTAFEGVDKANKITKTFTVNKKQEVRKAWQELEKFLGPIVEKLLKDQELISRRKIFARNQGIRTARQTGEKSLRTRR